MRNQLAQIVGDDQERAVWDSMGHQIAAFWKALASDGIDGEDATSIVGSVLFAILTANKAQ